MSCSKSSLYIIHYSTFLDLILHVLRRILMKEVREPSRILDPSHYIEDHRVLNLNDS